MSYEGYSQFLCKEGHYWTEDSHLTMYSELEENKCPICNESAIYENMVDVTNGSFDDAGNRIDNYKELKLVEKHSSVCSHCNKEHRCDCSIYKIPEDDEEEICECGHDTKDHSYYPDVSNNNLECDICECKNFKIKNEK